MVGGGGIALGLPADKVLGIDVGSFIPESDGVISSPPTNKGFLRTRFAAYVTKGSSPSEFRIFILFYFILFRKKKKKGQKNKNKNEYENGN